MVKELHRPPSVLLVLNGLGALDLVPAACPQTSRNLMEYLLNTSLGLLATTATTTAHKEMRNLASRQYGYAVATQLQLNLPCHPP